MQNDRKKYTSKEKFNSKNSESTSSDEYKVVRKSGASDRTDAKPRTPRSPRRDDSNSDFKPRSPRRDDRGPRRDDSNSDFKPRGPRRDDRGPRRDDSNSDFKPRGPRRDDRGPRRDDSNSDFKPRGPRYHQRNRNDDDSTEFKHNTLTSQDGTWRLNKYIANSGVCGRREADQLITDGKVTVNGKIITELGTKVTNKDTVKVDGSEISPEDFTYLLLNKPKNYITTMDDEKGRSTVMDLVKDATGLRVYPVGRLDRNTTGLLLMTNDGDLANRLMHPSYKVKKTYIVESSIALTDAQILEMRQGIMLDDGMAQAHEARRVPGSPNALKISIFEGRNRQIRRMIEYFKVEVIKLHRTYYAGLTVQDIRPGRWRFLKPDEVNNLRMLVKLFDLKQK